MLQNAKLHFFLHPFDKNNAIWPKEGRKLFWLLRCSATGAEL